MDTTFWRSKRVLVTGHTGFKGSWLCLWLRSLGAEVHGYALEPPTTPNLFSAAAVAGDLVDQRGDLADADALARAVERSRPEIVFHLAAQSLVRHGYRFPLETFETNALGTARLLDALRGGDGLRAVVVVTTDKCYRNREWDWGYRENDELGGRDPYAASKACAELICEAYRASFFSAPGADSPRLATARAGNVIGGGDWGQDRLVPDVLNALHEERAVEIRSPVAIRPWQHVLEPLGGYLTLARQLCGAAGEELGAGWNFGPDEQSARSVDWVVKKLHSLWPGARPWVADGGDHPHEAGYLKLDSSRARARLGWRGCLSLEQALEWTVEWHRLFTQVETQESDLRQLCFDQIQRYTRQAGESLG